MRSFKLFGALLAIVALGVIGVANASAAEFTSEEAGPLDGKALATQKFVTGAGTVECPELHVEGTAAISGTDQHVTIQYTNCKAFGFTAHISKATYTFTANGTVHLENNVTITVTVPFFECTLTVPATQTLTGVTYDNSGNNVTVTPNPVKNITSQGSGGACGGHDATGSYSGASEVTLKSGKKISVDTP